MPDITTKAGRALRYEDLTDTERDVFAEWCSCTPESGGQERCLEWFATMRAEAVRAERARLAAAVRAALGQDIAELARDAEQALHCIWPTAMLRVLALLEGEA